MRDKKRFVIKSTATELELYDDDVQIGEFPHFEWVAKSVDSVVDLLNEQQDTIGKLQKENIELKKLRKYCAEWMGVKEENLYDVVR